MEVINTEKTIMTAKTITVKAEENQNVFDTIDVIVNAEELLSLAQTEVTTWKNTGEFSLTVDTLEDYQLSYKVKGQGGENLSNILTAVDQQNPFIEIGQGNYKFAYQFIDQTFFDVAFIEITVVTSSQTSTKTYKINRLEVVI